MPRYSSLAFSSVVPSSSKVRWRVLEVVLDGLPDVGELVLDQGRRRGELVLGVELVEQLALDLLPRHRAVLLGQALLDRLAKLGERFKAERLGELVVDGDRACGASTDFTVTSNSASLPARCAVG